MIRCLGSGSHYYNVTRNCFVISIWCLYCLHTFSKFVYLVAIHFGSINKRYVASFGQYLLDHGVTKLGCVKNIHFANQTICLVQHLRDKFTKLLVNFLNKFSLVVLSRILDDLFLSEYFLNLVQNTWKITFVLSQDIHGLRVVDVAKICPSIKALIFDYFVELGVGLLVHVQCNKGILFGTWMFRKPTCWKLGDDLQVTQRLKSSEKVDFWNVVFISEKCVECPWVERLICPAGGVVHWEPVTVLIWRPLIMLVISLQDSDLIVPIVWQVIGGQQSC